MSIQQLQSDVNVAEEQELRRLEGGNVILSAGDVAVATTDVGSPLLLGGASVQGAQLVEANAAQPNITARVLPVAHASYAVPTTTTTFRTSDLGPRTSDLYALYT